MGLCEVRVGRGFRGWLWDLRGVAVKARCHRRAPLMAPMMMMMKKNKLEIEKKKKHLKEPLNSPGGEGAGQKQNGGNGIASMHGVLDLAEEVVRLRGMGPGRLLR